MALNQKTEHIVLFLRPGLVFETRVENVAIPLVALKV